MPQKPKDLDGKIRDEESEEDDDDMDEDEDEDDEEAKDKTPSEKYLVHGLFGSEDNSSLVRIVLST